MIGVGPGKDAAGLTGSGCRKVAEGAGVGGGGFAMTPAGDRSRFEALATAVTAGCGVIGTGWGTVI